ncbi:MAG: zf-TFIIB domain-containing protein [bacterium]|nr:zf-TFIIB domain-containing protein [bacterium]
MKCPVCNVEMKLVNYKGVEVDFCEKCKGVWFDLKEIDQLSDGVKEFNIVEPRLENMKLVKGINESVRECPRCGKEMDKVTMNSKPPIFDYCPNDCGYWFDADEVKEYVKNNMTAVEKPSVQNMVEILKRMY